MSAEIHATENIEKSAVNSNYPVHPLADAFPMLSEIELDRLAEDIKKNGLREPIKVFQGQLVDGRNRAEGCRRAGIEPKYEEWLGDPADLPGWIISTNVHRRHLKISQRAALGANWMAAHLDAANLPGKGDLRDRIGQIFSVSGRAVDYAATIRRERPDLFEQVFSGKISVNAAMKTLLSRKDFEARRGNVSPVSAQIRKENPLSFLRSLRPGAADLWISDLSLVARATPAVELSELIPLALSRLRPTGRAYLVVPADPAFLWRVQEILHRQLDFTVADFLIIKSPFRSDLKVTKRYSRIGDLVIHLHGPEAKPIRVAKTIELSGWVPLERSEARSTSGHLAKLAVSHATAPGDVVIDPISERHDFVRTAVELGRVGIACDPFSKVG